MSSRLRKAAGDGFALKDCLFVFLPFCLCFFFIFFVFFIVFWRRRKNRDLTLISNILSFLLVHCRCLWFCSLCFLNVVFWLGFDVSFVCG